MLNKIAIILAICGYMGLQATQPIEQTSKDVSPGALICKCRKPGCPSCPNCPSCARFSLLDEGEVQLLACKDCR